MATTERTAPHVKASTAMREACGFFALTYAMSWMCFVAASVTLRGLTPAAAGMSLPVLVLGLLGTVAPSIVALGLTARSEGVDGARSLLARIFKWRVAVRWYVFAAGYLATIKIGVALVHRIAVGVWPRFGVEPWYILAIATVLSTPVQAGEEIGWRGYALPRLAARLGLAQASLLLGIVWALWHLPLFFMPGTDNYGQSFAVFALQVTAISVPMAWLYARTSSSLLLVMLMHGANNQARNIVPSAVPAAAHALTLSTYPPAWLTVMLLWIAACHFLVLMRNIRLGPDDTKTAGGDAQRGNNTGGSRVPTSQEQST
jgi:membrane protease YdiL (CAAX protease family)